MSSCPPARPSGYPRILFPVRPIHRMRQLRGRVALRQYRDDRHADLRSSAGARGSHDGRPEFLQAIPGSVARCRRVGAWQQLFSGEHKGKSKRSWYCGGSRWCATRARGVSDKVRPVRRAAAFAAARPAPRSGATGGTIRADRRGKRRLPCAQGQRGQRLDWNSAKHIRIRERINRRGR